MGKNNEIQILFEKYCTEKLDNEYLRLCNKVHKKLTKKDNEIFSRGKSEIWAASIVWAVGSVNFLSDKSFLPHASLDDVCEWFGANSSTIVNKASQIRNFAKISTLNTEFLRTDSGVKKMLENLEYDKNGLIRIKNLEVDQVEPELPDEPEEPLAYIIRLTSSTKITNALVYQLEFLAKKTILSPDRFEKITISGHGTVDIIYFGLKSGLNGLMDAIKNSPFIISEITNYMEPQF
jgi:glutamyl/glutaminyl-tRNA synthetase